MGYSYRRLAGLLCIIFAAAIIVRILPVWAWYILVAILIGSICYLIYISFFS